MKYVIVILDGAAGWPLDELGGCTTLEAARTPNLDAMVRDGMTGLAQTVPPGAEPSSSAACTSILGYDPVADYVGRGAIEAASMGIELADDEIALRMNTVTIEDGVMASYSAGAISTEDSHEIVSALAAALDNETVRLYPGVAYRHILVVKGHPELLEATYTPPHDISDKPVAPHLPSGPGVELLAHFADRARPILAASATNARRVAEGRLPVTDVWFFWPGASPRGMVRFSEKRGVSGAMTSGVDLLGGLAVLSGLERLHIAGVTGGPDTDYRAQARGALDALETHDLVVVHVESPDEEGHAGNMQGKIEAIEAIDREVIGPIMGARPGLRVLAMPDHPTPIAIKTHVGDPVPFVLWGPQIAANGQVRYDERSAAATGLVVDPGRGVMDLLLS